MQNSWANLEHFIANYKTPIMTIKDLSPHSARTMFRKSLQLNNYISLRNITPGLADLIT